MFSLQENLILKKKCTTAQSFICKEVTSYKIHTLDCQWTPEEKCGLMEGPCIDDFHCLFDLICEANSCNGDFSNGTRCCTQPLPCNHTHARTDTCCNELHKCNINEGNCYDNNGCYGNLQCGTKNCDWSSEANCCTHPPNEGGK